MDFELRIPVRVTCDLETEVEANLSSRQRFWKPFTDFIEGEVERQDPSGARLRSWELDPGQIETSIAEVLPTALHRSMVSRLDLSSESIKSSLPPDHLKRLLAAKEVIVSAVSFSYGSLAFDLVFQPATKVIEAFDGNFDYFEAFLRQYVPDAFVSSVESTRHWQFANERLFLSRHYHVLTYNLHRAKQTFSSYTAPSGDTQSITSDPAAKARWMWIAANTSLVVPALVIAGFAYLWMSDRQRAIDSSYQDLAEAQNELVKALTESESDEKEAIASSYRDLVGAQNELIRALSEDQSEQRNRTPTADQ